MARLCSSNNSSCSYMDVKIEISDECEERLKRLFDQALLLFIEKEDYCRPLPAILGDGVKVDLFKLFVLVRERQGFDSVSRKGLWESVAERLGLDCSVSPSLRLLYSKYLDRMEKWAMEKSRIVNWDNHESERKGCLGGMLHELGDGFKALLGNGKCRKRNRAMVSGCKHVEESGSSELHRSSKRFRESSNDDGDLAVPCVDLSDDSVRAEEEEGLEVSSEKKDDFPEMLKWLTSVARFPHDPSIGVIPHWSDWKRYTGNDYWIQVTRAKKALLVQRGDAESRYQDAPFLGNHPSMYENDRKSTGRSRCSIRRPNTSKHSSGSTCNGSFDSLTNSRSNSCRELVIAPQRRQLMAGTSGVTDLQVHSNAITKANKAEIPRRYVAVGRRFQAQVDDWTGSDLDSDTKWLGTRIWPLETEESLEGNDLIGKGRPDSCSCDTLLSGSVECNRFHIAEKRMELKRDIGDAFFHWRFNQMGEEVSLRWTEREEKRFKDMITNDPENFWENAAKHFPGKKREQLVSYYFNVFLIIRRSYQNRVTPGDIDSDGEGAFGTVGNAFGLAAVTSLGSDIMICSQNNECHDYD